MGENKDLNEELSITPKLPPGFAENVLEYEIKVEYSPDISAIKALVELYSQAMEYFAANQDSKYLVFQKKLQKLLSRQDVDACIEESKEETPAEEDSKSMLDTHSEASLNSSQLLQQNLKSQERSLEFRIQARRLARNQVQEVDKSAGFRQPLSFQKEMESVVEEFVSMKMSRVREIKELYKQQLEELSDYDNHDIFTNLKKEMERNMEKEIEEISKQIDTERFKAIMALKNKCH